MALRERRSWCSEANPRSGTLGVRERDTLEVISVMKFGCLGHPPQRNLHPQAHVNPNEGRTWGIAWDFDTWAARRRDVTCGGTSSQPLSLAVDERHFGHLARMHGVT